METEMNQEHSQTHQPSDTQSDSFDGNIIPAETAARIEREGEDYKTTPVKNPEDGLDTTGGYTTSNEGLTNNYAVEPEMYYEERGDMAEKEAALKAERANTLREINETDQERLMNGTGDDRPKGVGMI